VVFKASFAPSKITEKAMKEGIRRGGNLLVVRKKGAWVTGGKTWYSWVACRTKKEPNAAWGFGKLVTPERRFGGRGQ